MSPSEKRSGQEPQVSKPKSPKGPEKTLEDRPQAAIDRRSFLTSTAAAGAVATAALPTQSAQAADTIAWDREVDVVVIGAGAGGLTAARRARWAGASAPSCPK